MATGKFQKWLEPDNLILLEGWARDGLTDEQIANNIGITRSTLNEWKKKYSVISDTLKKGKEVVDIEVENALLKRALGYSYTETRTKTENGKITETITIMKEVAPDTTAQIYWLNNRKSDKWRNKQKEETDTATLEKLDLYLAEIREDAARSGEDAVHE